MPASVDEIPTADELREKEAECITLLSITIPSWYANRGSGRWNGIDPARKQCIISRVQPDLRLGRMPSAEDNRALFELGRVSEMSPTDKKWISKWRKTHFKDPRQKANISKARATTQRSLLEFFRITGARDGEPSNAKKSTYLTGGPSKGRHCSKLRKLRHKLARFRMAPISSCG